MELKSWIDNKIQDKKNLNEKYRELAERGEPLYDGRILFGSGYIQAMQDVLKFLTKDESNELPFD